MHVSLGGGERGKDAPVAWDRREESPKSTEVAPGFSLRSVSRSGFERGLTVEKPTETVFNGGCVQFRDDGGNKLKGVI